MNYFLKLKKSGKKAFTLLEMIIVLSLIGILLSTVFSILFVVLRQQVRIYRIVETRRQGDTILNFMKEKILRATEVTNATFVEQCTPALPAYAPPNAQNFLLADAALRYRFYLVGNDLVYNEPPGVVTTPLNNNRVRVSGLAIECLFKSVNSTPVVQFSYTVTFLDATPSVEEGTVTLFYRSKVKLR